MKSVQFPNNECTTLRGAYFEMALQAAKDKLDAAKKAVLNAETELKELEAAMAPATILAQLQACVKRAEKEPDVIYAFDRAVLEKCIDSKALDQAIAYINKNFKFTPGYFELEIYSDARVPLSVRNPTWCDANWYIKKRDVKDYHFTCRLSELDYKRLDLSLFRFPCPDGTRIYDTAGLDENPEFWIGSGFEPDDYQNTTGVTQYEVLLIQPK